jgi:nucleoside-diphosphate-sugar epimerase
MSGMSNLLAAAQTAKVRRFVQVGASGSYMGDGKPMIGITEEAPLAYPSLGTVSRHQSARAGTRAVCR